MSTLLQVNTEVVRGRFLRLLSTRWAFPKIGGPINNYRPQNSRALIIRTPTKRHPQLIETAKHAVSRSFHVNLGKVIVSSGAVLASPKKAERFCAPWKIRGSTAVPQTLGGFFSTCTVDVILIQISQGRLYLPGPALGLFDSMSGPT